MCHCRRILQKYPYVFYVCKNYAHSGCNFVVVFIMQLCLVVFLSLCDVCLDGSGCLGLVHFLFITALKMGSFEKMTRLAE